MKSYYGDNKDSLDSIKVLSNNLISKYSFTSAYLRDHQDLSSIQFSVHLSSTKCAGRYYDSKTLTQNWLVFMPKDTVCLLCSPEEELQLKQLLADKMVAQLIAAFSHSKVKALQITPEGVFFALGPSLEASVNLEGGIFLPFNKDTSSMRIVDKIDENAYLADGVIP